MKNAYEGSSVNFINELRKPRAARLSDASN